jgi:hypothetical protein
MQVRSNYRTAMTAGSSRGSKYGSATMRREPARLKRPAAPAQARRTGACAADGQPAWPDRGMLSALHAGISHVRRAGRPCASRREQREASPTARSACCPSGRRRCPCRQRTARRRTPPSPPAATQNVPAPGGASKNPVWAGPGGSASRRVSFSSRSSRAFSARSRLSSSARSAGAAPSLSILSVALTTVRPNLPIIGERKAPRAISPIAGRNSVSWSVSSGRTELRPAAALRFMGGLAPGVSARAQVPGQGQLPLGRCAATRRICPSGRRYRGG